ncbi:MAG: OmpA family protein [Anaeromyxobacter sp.]
MPLRPSSSPAPSRRPVPAALLLLAAVQALACAGAPRGPAKPDPAPVRAQVDAARKAGAERCAAEELARAEEHLASADLARSRGYLGGEVEHLRAAAREAEAALARSAHCPAAPAAATEAAASQGPEPTPASTEGRPAETGAAAAGAVAAPLPDADGDGVPDADDACPEEAGPTALGCPANRDGDGLDDPLDRCALDAEDLDGFQDEDGCPDADNDGDGVVDRSDACPNTPGSVETRGCPSTDADGDGVPDGEDRCPQAFGAQPEGCPRLSALVEVHRDRLVLAQPIAFTGGDVQLAPASGPVLDAVAAALVQDFPRMRVTVEVHVDGAAGADAARALSARRAAAIQEALAARGVAPGRIDAVGLGSSRPVASDRTARGREANRRVEVRVLAVQGL